MRYQKITRNGDFHRAYKKGKNTVHPHVVVYVMRNRVGHTRIGITASKKVGGAVARNRARRVLLAALREVLPKDVGPWDIILVARGRTPSLKSWRVAATLRAILPKHGITIEAKQ